METNLYLSGPMAGLVDHNIPTFNKAAAELTQKGYKVWNPARFGADEDDMSWEDYLRRDLADVLRVEALALLPGWTASKGAQLEVYVAQALGMPCRLVSSYLDDEDEEIARQGDVTTAEVTLWKIDNFGETGAVPTTLGLAEECGELCRAVLKRDQGIRGDADYWTAEVKKEVADVVIKAHDVAGVEGFDLQMAVSERWEEISRRNWRDNPLTG